MTAWQLTIDANDPARLVRFWATVLGYEPQPPPTGFDTWNDWYRSVGVPDEDLDVDGDGMDRIQDPAGEGPLIWFQLVPEVKSGKNRWHLDLPGVDPERRLPAGERARLVDQRIAELTALGATVLRRYPDDFDDQSAEGHFVVMGDPEGNEFCVS